MSAPGLAACEFSFFRGLGVRSATLIAPLPVWNSEVVDKMAPFEGNKALGKLSLSLIRFDLLKLTAASVHAAEKKRLDREQAAKMVANKAGTAEPEEARRGAGDRLSEQPEGAAAGQPFQADFGADFFAHQEFGGGFGERDALGIEIKGSQN